MNSNSLLSNFFEDNRKKLFLYILKLSGDRDDAEDIFQDTFIRYAKKYSEQMSVPLLFTIAKNVFTDLVRSRKNLDVLDDTDIQSGSTPESDLISSRGENSIYRALNKLEQDDREMLAMAGQDGLSYAEIAAIKRMSVANVKVRIHRARIKLKEILEDING